MQDMGFKNELVFIIDTSYPFTQKHLAHFLSIDLDFEAFF